MAAFLGEPLLAKSAEVGVREAVAWTRCPGHFVQMHSVASRSSAKAVVFLALTKGFGDAAAFRQAALVMLTRTSNRLRKWITFGVLWIGSGGSGVVLNV